MKHAGAAICALRGKKHGKSRKIRGYSREKGAFLRITEAVFGMIMQLAPGRKVIDIRRVSRYNMH